MQKTLLQMHWSSFGWDGMVLFQVRRISLEQHWIAAITVNHRLSYTLPECYLHHQNRYEVRPMLAGRPKYCSHAYRPIQWYIQQNLIEWQVSKSLVIVAGKGQERLTCNSDCSSKVGPPSNPDISTWASLPQDIFDITLYWRLVTTKKGLYDFSLWFEWERAAFSRWTFIGNGSLSYLSISAGASSFGLLGLNASGSYYWSWVFAGHHQTPLTPNNEPSSWLVSAFRLCLSRFAWIIDCSLLLTLVT